jgi:hypothetical protein
MTHSSVSGEINVFILNEHFHDKQLLKYLFYHFYSNSFRNYYKEGFHRKPDEMSGSREANIVAHIK